MQRPMIRRREFPIEAAAGTVGLVTSSRAVGSTQAAGPDPNFHNTNDKEWPNKVANIYRNLINDLGLRANSVPLLAGETVNADQQGATASVNTIIAELPRVLPNSYVISSKGCESRSDHLHFTPAGYRELGKRYAEKMLELA
jgi:hypothetical protein